MTYRKIKQQPQQLSVVATNKSTKPSESPKNRCQKRRLLHFLMTRELKQRRATLAEEIQRCVRIQHFDGVLRGGPLLKRG